MQNEYLICTDSGTMKTAMFFNLKQAKIFASKKFKNQGNIRIYVYVNTNGERHHIFLSEKRGNAWT